MTSEVWTPRGLVTYHVLFVIDLQTRRVEIAGISRLSGAEFTAQVARNLTDCFDGFLRNHRFVICDRDSKFTDKSKSTLKDAGVDVTLCQYQAPNCKAYAERFVLSIESECLNDRQLALIEHALDHLDDSFTAGEHARFHGVSQPTAWKDLTTMVGQGLLEETKRGRKSIYHPTERLESLADQRPASLRRKKA